MSTVDFSKPVTSDAYTAWPTELQGNMQSLGFMLDPAYVTSYANLTAGMYRFNKSTGVLEQYSGTAWAAQATGYTLKAGDTFTGAMTFTNNVALQWKDSGGTARRVALLNSGNNIFLGDVDNTIGSGSTYVRSSQGVEIDVNGAQVIVFGSGSFTAYKSMISYNVQEAHRVEHDAGYISGWNTANSTRTGYLQFNTGADVRLMSENGAALKLGTGGTIRAVIDTSGNFAIGTATVSGSAFAVTTGVGGTVSNDILATRTTAGTAAVGANSWIQLWNSTDSLGSGMQTYNGGSIFWGYNGGWQERGRFDNNGAFLWGTTSSLWWVSGRGTVEVNGSSTAIYGLKIGGTAAGYFYHDGTNAHVMNSLAGSLTLDTNGITRVTVGSAGNTVFAGSAATTPTKPAAASGALTFDCRTSNVFEQTLNGNATSLTLSNLSDGQTVNIFFTQDATGTRTLSGLTSANGYVWPGGVAGVLSTAANAVDLLCCTYRATTGKVYCTLTKAFS
jgi:hypothetical protein